MEVLRWGAMEGEILEVVGGRGILEVAGGCLGALEVVGGYLGTLEAGEG